ncbi:hypothetical protein ACFE04_014978 [Oxalis oulophora]
MDTLVHLEALCERLYNSQDSAEREHAERTLNCFRDHIDYIPQCQYILENSSNAYALMLASSSLLKQVTEHSLPLQLRLDIRNYLIDYLATRGPHLATFVLGSLIQLLCRVTKFGWLDDERFKELVNDATEFLYQGPHHRAIGLKILNQIVSEMNEWNQRLPLIRHRRISSDFLSLLVQIFKLSLTSLNQVKNDSNLLTSMKTGSKLEELALSLSHKCLSYDFVGSSYDNTDDLVSIRVPHSWRAVVEDPSTLDIFFYFYEIQTPFSKEALECLVHLASLRQAVFTDNAARLKFLAHLMMLTKQIMQKGIGLSDYDNYHVFCRLLGRFQVNYRLSELVGSEGYIDWIHLVTEFTSMSFQSWQWASSSVCHLLVMWSGFVKPATHLKSDSPSQLDKLVPKLVESFISSRLVSLQSDQLSENYLDDAANLQDQIESFPSLCRHQYQSCCTHILNIMDPLLQMYKEVANLQNFVDNNELSVVETKLAWIVHIIAAMIKDKNISVSRESHQVCDAELSARVLQLINVTDSGSHTRRYGEISKQRLDHAILTFCQSFKRSYVGSQTLIPSNVLYTRLSEIVGLHDHMSLLNTFAGKIALNLKSYESDEVIKHSLRLLLEMVSGHALKKLLLGVDNIKFMISHQSAKHFPFLRDCKHSRNRTNFYYIFGLLVFLEDSFLKFKSSRESLQQVFESLDAMPDANFRMDAAKNAFIGLMRDLRGLTSASDSSRTYGFLFDWVYPERMQLLCRAIVHWSDTPEVTTPLLKFVSEFVWNNSQRMTFDSSSANGILLFREVSKLMVAYGSSILSRPNSADKYTFKYKGIWISLEILSRALSGEYVIFGVFELYGDRALVDALDIGLKMALSIPIADVLAYRKVGKSYFAFLEVLLGKNLAYFLPRDESTFICIINSLEAGIRSSNTSILPQCATTVFNLASFHFSNTIMGESPSLPAAISLSQHIANLPDLFLQMSKTLFEVILFNESESNWILSKALLSLLLISEKAYVNMKSMILDSQKPEHIPQLSSSFDDLMKDVSRSLSIENCDRFSQNLSRFRRDFRTRISARRS